MAVIDGMFCLFARMIYEEETVSRDTKGNKHFLIFSEDLFLFNYYRTLRNVVWFRLTIDIALVKKAAG